MQSIIEKLGLAEDNAGVFDGKWRGGGAKIDKISPIDGRRLASIRTASDEDYEAAITRAQEAFLKWRLTPGPVRGETVRWLGNALRGAKHELGQLVTLESGKIVAEGEGEVQEMIDICDLAVGQSRMLYGLTIQSERPFHRLMEQWHPLGLVAVISAFNFPVAVWSWNAALAAVCGDATIWKPSEKTPLSAIAVTKIAERVCRETSADPAIFTLLIGDRKTVGQKLADDRRIPLVSATGSEPKCLVELSLGHPVPVVRDQDERSRAVENDLGMAIALMHCGGTCQREFAGRAPQLLTVRQTARPTRSPNSAPGCAVGADGALAGVTTPT